MTVAFLYPGHSAEDDYPRAAERLGVALPVVHTRMDSDAHRVPQLRQWGADEALTEGAAALPGGIAAVVWACTSGSFVFGLDGARRQARVLAAAAGIPATSTSLAFADAVRALDLRSLAVAATYPADVADLFVDFLRAAGGEVVSVTGADIVLASDVGTLDRDGAVRLAVSGDHPDAQAVLLPDTALHSIDILDELAAAVGKPVLTANQVSIWAGLRLAGHRGDLPPLGALHAADLPDTAGADAAAPGSS